ncbi:phosphosulfolactate synthase [Paenibacillus paeoniae]|uniref:Phosphosulfolactate synthase n=1 Tax=Paenibacillus paeoniae TaxID=2292705 RepID=A0A371PMJ4_9BACL|nr:phosphosulfolactate synthase [Paenibacillus paeoniae]REK77353.1 phosphosulfolactate synthase [Paenibacillus paeoniae]
MRSAVLDNWHQLLRDPSGCRTADRRKGLGTTMVIDKGMGLNAFSDFIETAGPFIEIVKFGFGTAVLYDQELLRNKLSLAAGSNMIAMPGGTLLEVAIAQKAVGSFLDKICSLGFTGVEISDGTIELARIRRTSLIKECIKRGLTVMTEYGKKTAGSGIDPEELAFTAHCDWEAGAELVTIEARESGLNVGLFDEQGRCKEHVLMEVLGKVDHEGRLMWEAPLKSQQAELLLQFGASVHLGNIAPTEALSLEAMRRGLRSDTFGFGQRQADADYMI